MGLSPNLTWVPKRRLEDPIFVKLAKSFEASQHTEGATAGEEHSAPEPDATARVSCDRSTKRPASAASWPPRFPENLQETHREKD